MKSLLASSILILTGAMAFAAAPIPGQVQVYDGVDGNGYPCGVAVSVEGNKLSYLADYSMVDSNGQLIPNPVDSGKPLYLHGQNNAWLQRNLVVIGTEKPKRVCGFVMKSDGNNIIVREASHDVSTTFYQSVFEFSSPRHDHLIGVSTIGGGENLFDSLACLSLKRSVSGKPIHTCTQLKQISP